MTMDNLKKSWATASPADPIAKPAQSAAERMRAYRQGMKAEDEQRLRPRDHRAAALHEAPRRLR